MAQRIFVELLLFLVPFAVFLVYRAASRDLKIRDRWPLTRLVIIGTVLAVAALIIVPLLEPSESDKCFSPARYVDGKTISPEEIPCAEKQLPGQLTDPSAPPRPVPVAPRDEGR